MEPCKEIFSLEISSGRKEILRVVSQPMDARRTALVLTGADRRQALTSPKVLSPGTLKFPAPAPTAPPPPAMIDLGKHEGFVLKRTRTGLRRWQRKYMKILWDPVPCVAYWSVPARGFTDSPRDKEWLVETPPSGVIPLHAILNIELGRTKQLVETVSSFHLHHHAKEHSMTSSASSRDLSVSGSHTDMFIVSVKSKKSETSSVDKYEFKAESLDEAAIWVKHLIEAFAFALRISAHLEKTAAEDALAASEDRKRSPTLKKSNFGSSINLIPSGSVLVKHEEATKELEIAKGGRTSSFSGSSDLPSPSSKSKFALKRSTSSLSRKSPRNAAEVIDDDKMNVEVDSDIESKNLRSRKVSAQSDSEMAASSRARTRKRSEFGWMRSYSSKILPKVRKRKRGRTVKGPTKFMKSLVKVIGKTIPNVDVPLPKSLVISEKDETEEEDHADEVKVLKIGSVEKKEQKDTMTMDLVVFMTNLGSDSSLLKLILRNCSHVLSWDFVRRRTESEGKLGGTTPKISQKSIESIVDAIFNLDSEILHSVISTIFEGSVTSAWSYSLYLLWIHGKTRLRESHLCRTSLTCELCKEFLQRFQEFVQKFCFKEESFSSKLRLSLLNLMLTSSILQEDCTAKLEKGIEPLNKKIGSAELWSLFLLLGEVSSSSTRTEVLVDISALFAQTAFNVRTLICQDSWMDSMYRLLIVSQKDETDTNYKFCMGIYAAILFHAFLSFSSKSFQRIVLEMLSFFRSQTSESEESDMSAEHTALKVFRTIIISFVTRLTNSRRRFPLRISLKKESESANVWNNLIFLSAYCRRFAFATSDWGIRQGEVKLLPESRSGTESDYESDMDSKLAICDEIVGDTAKSDDSDSVESKDFDYKRQEAPASRRHAFVEMFLGKKSPRKSDLCHKKIWKYGLHFDFCDDEKYNDVVLLERMVELYHVLQIDKLDTDVLGSRLSEEQEACMKFRKESKILSEGLDFLKTVRGTSTIKSSDVNSSCRRHAKSSASTRKTMTTKLIKRLSSYESPKL